jgi:hypothetical protein
MLAYKALLSMELGDRKDVLLNSIWQFVASWYALDHYVLLLDARIFQSLLCAIKQRVDDLCVPPCMDDADAQLRTYTSCVNESFMTGPVRGETDHRRSWEHRGL